MTRILPTTIVKNVRHERYWFIGINAILLVFTLAVILWALLQLSKAEFIFFPIGEILAPIVIATFVAMFGVFLACSSIGRRLARRHSWGWKGYVLVYMVSFIVAYSPLEYRVVGGWYYRMEQDKLYETAAKEIQLVNFENREVRDEERGKIRFLDISLKIQVKKGGEYYVNPLIVSRGQVKFNTEMLNFPEQQEKAIHFADEELKDFSYRLSPAADPYNPHYWWDEDYLLYFWVRRSDQPGFNVHFRSIADPQRIAGASFPALPYYNPVSPHFFKLPRYAAQDFLLKFP